MSKSRHIKDVVFRGSVAIVRLTETITFANLQEVQKEFSEATKDQNIQSILFDLKEVSDADSSGLAALVDLLAYMKDHDMKGKIGLLNLSDSMRSLISISKFSDFFKEYKSEKEALKDLEDTAH